MMSDEAIKARLIEISQHVQNYDTVRSRNQGWLEALDRALDRITNAPAPPPPGGVAVRVAVAVGTGWQGNTVYTDAIDAYQDEHEATASVRSCCTDGATHFAIITAHIPPVVVPEVIATVEPAACEREATA